MRLDQVRERLGEALFTRVAGPDGPQQRDRIHARPGPRWFEPGSPITQVHADASMFIGGIRALLLQSLHPAAMRAVSEHSGYRGDMWGRLARTSHFLAVTTFGHAEDAEAAVALVRRIHDHVRGTMPDGTPYAASDPHLLHWVHLAEIDSFLRAYEVYGARPLSRSDRDTYISQSAEVARRLGTIDPPTTQAQLTEQLARYRPELRGTPEAREAVSLLLLRPPMSLPARLPYGVLAAAAIGLMPRWTRRQLLLPWLPVTERTVVPALGKVATGTIRWALSAPPADFDRRLIASSHRVSAESLSITAVGGDGSRVDHGAMEKIAWGSQGLTASPEGLGAMGMSAYYGDRDDAESAATLNLALDLGVSLIDTAEAYGPFLNERLIAASIGHRKDEFAIATKFGFHLDNDGTRGGVDGSPAYARIALERSLTNLKLEAVDLYYVHRIDPAVPIEETIGALSELVAAGKIRCLGISEAAPETIRRAHATHPLTAVQTEYSLFQREPETNGVLDTCRELGIAFVAYSPLGRGVLTGAISSAQDLAKDDFRRTNPRFADQALSHNLGLVEGIRELARTHGVTPGQLALAWVLAQDGVVAIPGTKRRHYLEENVAAAELSLSQDDLDTLDALVPVGAAAGQRYDDTGMRMLHH